MPYIPVSHVLLICFWSFTLILLFYYLFFFLRLALRRSRSETAPDPQHRRPISLIICAFNEEANLTKNLPLWLNQDYHRNGQPAFEVLVINDNSEDDTFYLLNRLCEEHAHLRVVHLTQVLRLPLVVTILRAIPSLLITLQRKLFQLSNMVTWQCLVHVVQTM
ncbi:MAG: glycosyltransferase [Chitinophagaceae bacterium]|nr:glycosyltransferase [Chitinophagaceae bacterium]